MNYLDITTEDILQRFDVIPEILENAGLSEKTALAIKSAAGMANLSGEQTEMTSRLIGLVFAAFINRTDFGNELEKNLGLGTERLAPVILEIETKIFEPIKEELDVFYQSQNKVKKSAPEPKQEKETLPRVAEKQSAEAPIFTPSSPPPPKTKTPPKKSTKPDSPFLIHKEEEVESVSSPKHNEELVRPYFFESSPETDDQIEKPLSARLEIGGKEQKIAHPKKGKTKKPDVRVVNYSGPETQTNPFGKQPDRKKKPEEEKKKNESINPDNVLNLKDLPK